VLEWISNKTVGTAADRSVVDALAESVDSTRSRAGVDAALVDASAVELALGATQTLRSVVRLANSQTAVNSAGGVRIARRWVTNLAHIGLGRNWSCK